MEPLTTDEEVALLKRLLTGTTATKVKWTLANNDFSFFAQVGRFTYLIGSQDTDDVAPFELAIYDTANRPPSLVHRIVTSDFGIPNDHLSALYIVVKKKHLGIENVAADIFNELDRFGVDE
jgi:hypothetical protein